ncbi:LOW QUALITY PROTEIN: hypothetical protein NC653_025005 [Populus alba x Populus x berolinensis]|uniref:Uncharacterized protein n=1 Tax=Populus alba x Populus x berolinensis TaxID=444605 RepID=A0AAD6Q8I8_9ROSI|nr:LOW QUALITY PROTEIN: hypothetical protein NC653_025005 [Populus alba x Populus x berolinensis]
MEEEAIHNKTTSDAKSRVSSPISNSQSTFFCCSHVCNCTLGGKRPRPVKYDDEQSHITFLLRTRDLQLKNGGVSQDLMSNLAGSRNDSGASCRRRLSWRIIRYRILSPRTDQNVGDLGGLIEETRSPKNESAPSLRVDDDCDENLMVSALDCPQDDEVPDRLMVKIYSQFYNFNTFPLGKLISADCNLYIHTHIYLFFIFIPSSQAPPSSSSPERDIQLWQEKKPVMVSKGTDEKALKRKKTKVTGEEVESQKLHLLIKRGMIDLQPQSSSLPLPMFSMTGWSRMGFLTWGIVFWVLFDSFILWPYNALDSLLWGNDIFVSADIWHLYKELYPWMEAPCLLQPYSQPRPKRCATHCYIARNIHCYQQFTRMNPFWPPAAGSALQYGAKACNMNVVPSADLHAGRGVFPGPKNQLPHSLPHQQRQQMQSQTVSPQARQLESELGGEDSPSTAGQSSLRPNTSLYGQNLMPIHPANFALMNPTPMGGAHSASGNTSEKKPRQPQTQVSKAGAETFSLSGFCHNHALLQSLPEAARHGYHLIPAAQAAQQKKNYRVSEEGKTGGNDTSNVEEERKAITGVKAPLTAGQSIVFSRADLTDSPISTMPVNNVIDSSARTLNLGSTPSRTSGSLHQPSKILPNNKAEHKEGMHRYLLQLTKNHLLRRKGNQIPAVTNPHLPR